MIRRSLLALALLPSLAAAQSSVGGGFDSDDPVWTSHNVHLARLGSAVAALGDVNRDGVPDVIAGCRSGYSVWIYSGRNGDQIRQIDGSSADFGKAVAAAGDIDGDGVEDFLVGDPGSTSGGSAFAYSGATGSLLRRLDAPVGNISFGHSIAGLGDLDGDTVPDIAVGAPYADPSGLTDAGSVFVFSGASGNQLHQFDGLTATDRLGWDVLGTGDLTGDGVGDIAAGAGYASPARLTAAGSVFVFSGASGNLAWRTDGLRNGDLFGNAIDVAGDIDGDTVPDLVVGALGADSAVGRDSGAAFVLSGTSGTVIRRFDGLSAGGYLGWDVAGLGDVNGDGRPDLGLGAPNAMLGMPAAAGQIVVFSPIGRKILDVIDGRTSGGKLGYSVVGVGDATGDGLSDLGAGAPDSRTNAQGTVCVHAWRHFLTATSTAMSAASGSILGYQVEFRAEDAGSPYILLMSLSGTGPFSLGGLDIPLTLDPILITTFFGDFGSPILQSGFRGTLNRNGHSAAYLGFPAGLLSPFVGFRFHLAAICGPVGTLPDTASGAVELLIVP